MKKITLFFVFLLVATSYSTAQKTVALHSNGTTTIFGGETPLTEAYTAAITGDTLYVSGGVYTLPTNIEKGLVIIGAGYHPEFTEVTQKTVIENPSGITLGNNASNSYFEGIEFSYNFQIQPGVITDFTFIRCKFKGTLTSTGPSNLTNATIAQCDVQGNLQLDGITNSLITNCILRSQLLYSVNNIVKNNIFLNGNNIHINQCDNNVFWNNIFSTLHSSIAANSSSNNFQYNICRQPNPGLGSSPIDLNNYKDVDITTIYVNASEGDYHLQEGASTTYLGDDGTVVGLYGGVLPFKEGAVPINPHISQKTIQTTTDSNGLLNISFTVEAQQN